MCRGPVRPLLLRHFIDCDGSVRAYGTRNYRISKTGYVVCCGIWYQCAHYFSRTLRFTSETLGSDRVRHLAGCTAGVDTGNAEHTVMVVANLKRW